MGTTSQMTPNGRQREHKPMRAKPTKAKRNRTLTPEDKAKLRAATKAYWSRWNAAKAAAAVGTGEPSQVPAGSMAEVTPPTKVELNVAAEARNAFQTPAGCPVDADGGKRTATVPVTPTEPEPAVKDRVIKPVTSPSSSPQPAGGADRQSNNAQEDAPEIAATIERISERWSEKQALKARDEENDFQLGKDLDLLHAQRAHHGNGTYDKDVAALNIPKTTAWRLRNHYRDIAGLSPIPEPELVPTGTNLATVSDATTGTPTPGAGSPPSPTASMPPTSPQKSGANFMRTRAQETKQVTQVRLIPSRHEIFHEALKKLSAQFETHDDSETIFHAITTYGVQ
jgi:hypothetical protein